MDMKKENESHWYRFNSIIDLFGTRNVIIWLGQPDI